MEQIAVNKNIQQLLKRKNIFLAVVVVLTSFMAAVSLFGNYSSKVVNYKKQIQEKLQKMDIITELEKSKEVIQKYKASFVKQLDGDSLLNQLADYATQNNIVILNVSPGQTNAKEDYITTNVHLSIRADTFKDLISFFYTMETSPYVFKIAAWSTRTEVDNLFNCDVDIVFVQMK